MNTYFVITFLTISSINIIYDLVIFNQYLFSDNAFIRSGYTLFVFMGMPLFWHWIITLGFNCYYFLEF